MTACAGRVDLDSGRMGLKRTVVVLVASLAFVASCNGDDRPSAEPSDTGVVTDTSTAPSTAPSSSTGPTKTTPTSEPKATREGAIAAAKAGVKAIDHAYATWDVKPLEEMSNLASCEACRFMVQRFPQAERDGWTIKGGRFTFHEPPRVHTFVPSANGKVTATQVIVPVSLSKLTTRKPDGSIYDEPDLLGSDIAYNDVELILTLRWNDPWTHRWRLEDVKRQGQW